MKNKAVKVLSASVLLFSGLTLASCIKDEDYSNNNASVSAQISTLASENSALVSQIESLETTFNDNLTALTTKHNADVKTLEASIETMNTSITTLNETLNSKISEVKADYESKVATLKTEFDAKVAEINSSIGETEAKIEAAKADYNAKVEAAKTELNASIETLKTTYEAKVAELTASIEAANASITNLDAKLAEEVEAITAAYTQSVNALKTEADAKFAELNALMGELSATDAALLEQINAQKVKIEELEAKNAELADLLAELTKEVYYTVTFDANNNSEVFTQRVLKESYLVKPEVPVREGCKFVGWFNEYDEAWVFGAYEVRTDFVLTAKWEEVDHVLTYHEAVEATCLDGNVAYYSCANCDHLFLDEDATTVVTLDDVVVPAVREHTGVKYSVIDATLGGDAHVGKVCEECGHLFGEMTVAAPTEYKIALASEEEINRYFDVVATGTYTFAYENGTYKSNNQEQSSTEAIMELVAKNDVEMSFGYLVNSESNYDFLTVYKVVDGSATSILSTKVSGKNSQDVFGTLDVSLNAGEAVRFVYKKDGSGDHGEDCAIIREIKVSPDASVEIPYVVATFDTNGGTAVLPVVYTQDAALGALPVGPEKEGYLFRGWYADATYETPLSESTVISADTIYYANMKPVVNVNVFYNNGDEEVLQYAVGDKVSLPQTPLKEGFIFAGWYTTPTFEEGSAYTEAAVISEEMSLYADYVTLPSFAGTYKGLEVYGSNNGEGTISSTVYNGQITNTLELIHGTGSRGTINFSTYDDVANRAMVNYNKSTVPVWIFEEEGVIIYNYYSTNEDAVPGDMYVMFKGAETVEKVAQAVWASGNERLFEINVDGQSVIFYANKGTATIHCGVSVTTLIGDELSVDDVYASGSFAPGLVITAADGTELERYAYKNGQYGALDGYQGTYTGDAGEMVLSGAGDVVLDGISGTYVKVGDVFEVTVANKTVTYALVEGTYTMQLDNLVGTYTGAYGEIVVNGDGTLTVDGVSGIYTKNDTKIAYTINDVTTSVNLSVEDFTYSTKSMFAGYTFSGNYASWGGDETSYMDIEFEDSTDIVGTIYVDNSTTYYFDFTAEFVGNTLTMTITSAIDRGAVGKTIVATLTGNRLDIISCNISNQAYTFADEGYAVCPEFNA